MVSFVWLFICLFALGRLAHASSCNVVSTSTEPIRLIVPLYIDPSTGTAWNDILTAASTGVEIIAIINPNSGPDSSGPDSSYKTYMKKLNAAGVTLIAYIHTSYGTRSLSAVEADINTYNTLYTGLGLQGFFVDEASSSVAEISYYTSLYNYITKTLGYANVFINPGASTDESYLHASTNIMIYEDTQANVASTTLPPWVLCTNTTAQKSGWQYRFSAIAYGASVSQASSLIQQFHNKGVGYVYITDGADGCCTYNSLASYFSTEVTTIHSLN